MEHWSKKETYLGLMERSGQLPNILECDPGTTSRQGTGNEGSVERACVQMSE